MSSSVLVQSFSKNCAIHPSHLLANHNPSKLNPPIKGANIIGTAVRECEPGDKGDSAWAVPSLTRHHAQRLSPADGSEPSSQSWLLVAGSFDFPGCEKWCPRSRDYPGSPVRSKRRRGQRQDWREGCNVCLRDESRRQATYSTGSGPFRSQDRKLSGTGCPWLSPAWGWSGPFRLVKDLKAMTVRNRFLFYFS